MALLVCLVEVGFVRHRFGDRTISGKPLLNKPRDVSAAIQVPLPVQPSRPPAKPARGSKRTTVKKPPAQTARQKPAPKPNAKRITVVFTGRWRPGRVSLALRPGGSPAARWRAGQCVTNRRVKQRTCWGEAFVSYELQTKRKIIGYFTGIWYMMPNGDLAPNDFSPGSGPRFNQKFVCLAERIRPGNRRRKPGRVRYLCKLAVR